MNINVQKLTDTQTLTVYSGKLCMILNLIHVHLTISLVITEGPHDVLCQLKSC